MGDYIKEQLGAYKLIKLLGSGGFADVYLGEHIHLGTRAAIKVLHTRLVAQDVASFRNEARTIAQLAHPNIVRVLDFNIEGETPYLVLDYAPNGTLRQRHPKGSELPLSIVVFYVKQVASALQYAHNLKIVHRDVKPENILLGRGNEILLSDFGIAVVAQTSQLSRVLDAAGTISYMAPEQIQGRPQPASDQYALAIIAYEWLCGKRPFNGTFSEVAAMQTVIRPLPLSNFVKISPQAEQVVLKALEKEPSRRFASVEEFAKALEAAATGSAIREPSAREPVVKRVESDEVTTKESAMQGAAFRKDAAIDSPLFPLPSSTPLIHRKSFSPKNIFIVSLSLLLLIALTVAGVFWRATSTQNPQPTKNIVIATATAIPVAAAANDTIDATVIAANPDTYSSKQGKLALYDSLSQTNSKWSEGSNSSYGGDCEFAQGGYQVSQSKPNKTYLCGNFSGSFANFVLEVQVTVVAGDCGGVYFRYDDKTGNSYLFTVCQDGYYGLYVYPPGNSTTSVKTLRSDFSQAIHAGYNQSNILAVVANGSNFDLYVNKQKVGSASDATYSNGSFAMAAITDGRYPSSTVLYRNARVWTL